MADMLKDEPKLIYIYDCRNMSYQKCPLCKAKGVLKKDTCPVCLGERVIDKKSGLPPSRYVAPYQPYVPYYPYYPSTSIPCYPWSGTICTSSGSNTSINTSQNN